MSSHTPHSSVRVRRDGAEYDAVRFHGSTTQMSAITAWIAGEDYRAPAISTRDIRNMELDGAAGPVTVRRGDWVLREVPGRAARVRAEDFARDYEVVEPG